MALDDESGATWPTPAPSAQSAPEEPLAPPIQSRFLFVDVAAQRAKQLRRGALPRLAELRNDASAASRPDRFHKLERIAMEEVTRRLIAYTLPDQSSRSGGGT
jgi:DNA-directed RNA polymerase subunit K/omega